MKTVLTCITETNPEVTFGFFFVICCSLIISGFYLYTILYPDDGKTTNFLDDFVDNSYEKVEFMTVSEVKFFRLLQQAVNQQYLLLCQIPLSQIVTINTSKGSDTLLKRILIDYILFDLDAQTPLLSIELIAQDEDTSQVQVQKESYKDKVLNDAGIPVMRFYEDKLPNIKYLQTEIQKLLETHVFEEITL